MPRRTFTSRDLAPLRKVTERILERQPDAAVVASAAEPFKRRIQTARHDERTPGRLPVHVETTANPEGVPLHEIARVVRQEVPGVTGISVTPGGVSLKFDRPPTASQRRKIDSLLSDPVRLEELKPGIRGARPAPGAAAPRGEADLQRVMRDPETSDAAWLRAFRSYAMEHLVPPPGDRPPPPAGPARPPSGPERPPVG